MSNNMYDNITGRSPIATDDLGYIGTGKKASQIMSGGTTDYDALTNKPTINSVELSGNKTSSDLGLQSALTETQIAAVNSGVTSETVSQVETNKNNISSFHKASGTDIYFSETEPTGMITEGSYWLSKTATKRYEMCTRAGIIEQGTWDAETLDKTGSTVRCRIDSEIMVKAGNEYTIIISNAPVETNRMGINYRNALGGSIQVSGWISAKNGETTITIPNDCIGITVIFSNIDSSTCQPSDFGNFVINGVAWA